MGDDARRVTPERRISVPHTFASSPLRVPQPPGGGQDGGEHPDPTGRQPGAAAELQRLRRESGGLPEDRRGPVRAQAADVEYLHG